MPVTIGHALRDARKKIDALDARVLLCHVIKRDTAYLIAHGDAPLGCDDQRAFDALIARRVAGEPIAYITGRREFFGLDFKVSPAVLIPRPETELLVELALERIPRDKSCSVLDLGTGSGCMAVSIARHRPLARVMATDISSDALALARENARALDVHNIECAVGDWFGGVDDRSFDLIVSNPPYVADGDPHLTLGDVRFEPRAALVAGADGLDCIRGIVAHGASHLAPGGWLMFEHGHDQAARCRKLLSRAGFAAVFSRRDVAGIERVSGGRAPDLDSRKEGGSVTSRESPGVCRT
ncbi:MAG: protein-(glutamine-N5) methyltransferase, release factor-specific [Betaproteobacteria bacterium RIFCSPLOWO2_12_FULL_62_58]|nr:MAG: protein-(glutamine-N5) methyltransferase, release factor-specific [Betaproteobacteria bacterium RIFCSPLOWO2_02_FULL_62_79]OGA49145.1 MAG: protein-(glutamine-N5) methyltransferase, release factor-specific [Betaproteobacteria bacterium RIFCSPLOWO2_12_FULL_62_58]